MLMQYFKYSPCKELLPYVECYFVWESDETLQTELLVESPPSGFCSLVINYGEPYFLQNKKYERLVVPKQFIAGQSIFKYTLSLPPKIGIAGIVFKPAALATLFGLSTFELTEERIDLFALLPQAYFRDYVEKIKVTPIPEEKAKLLEELLLHHCRHEQPQPDYIDCAANRIVETNGVIQLQDLLKESCMSRRTFERRFFQKVGLSPKYYARIRRISHLCNLIAGKKKVDWKHIFYEAEYYDQAHFIKDFEEFTGRTPNQFLQENIDMTNFVEKPKTQTLQ
jgi:AraC-like DNA-binding protein